MTSTLDTELSEKIDLFISVGSRGEYLQAAYSYLATILPTNVDCRMCFSTVPYVGYKICSDDILDALICVKNYLKQ